MTKRNSGTPWTEERLSRAVGMLSGGMSLTKAAAEMGITRRALTEGLRRANRLNFREQLDLMRQTEIEELRKERDRLKETCIHLHSEKERMRGALIHICAFYPISLNEPHKTIKAMQAVAQHGLNGGE